MQNKIRQVSLIPELRFPSKRYAGFHYSGFMMYFAPVYSSSYCELLDNGSAREFRVFSHVGSGNMYFLLQNLLRG